MANYQAKDSLVLGRQLAVQRLSIPFKIVGSATAANVVATNDEPCILFINTAGVTQSTGAVPSTETATFTTSASDSAGTFNALVRLNEQAVKVCAVYAIIPAVAAAGGSLGSASGISVVTATSANGTCLLLSVPTGTAYNTTATVIGCLEVEYICAE